MAQIPFRALRSAGSATLKTHPGTRYLEIFSFATCNGIRGGNGGATGISISLDRYVTCHSHIFSDGWICGTRTGMENVKSKSASLSRCRARPQPASRAKKFSLSLSFSRRGRSGSIAEGISFAIGKNARKNVAPRLETNGWLETG